MMLVVRNARSYHLEYVYTLIVTMVV